MSQRSGYYPDPAPQRGMQGHPAHGGAYYSARSTHPRHVHPNHERGYTLNHAGRQVRFGPVAFWIVVGTVVIMAGWSAVTATYFAFRDDVLTRLLARQAEMQYAYEDRIAELRAQVDRTTSRQLLDQEQFEKKLDMALRRQNTLEQRAATLSTLPDATVTGSIKPSGKSDAAPVPPAPSKLSPFGEAPRTAPAKNAGGMNGVLVRLQNALDVVEQRQIAALQATETALETRSRRMRAVFGELELDPPADTALPPSATGGPFVPAPGLTDTQVFERQLARVQTTRALYERLTRALAAVPYRKPVLGEIETSSGFGVRSDPFLGRPAMHTGLDFRADSGDPVRATAAGKVVTAGWSGGYGKLVEIDHGNGITTRYGHLSEIEVEVGDAIKIGQVIGAIGSTGRSTGPHLHYETRIEGEPVDPQKFLRAGARLGG